MPPNIDHYQKERDKLAKIFESLDADKQHLAEGLIEDAAFFYAENKRLDGVIKAFQSRGVHPSQLEVKRPDQGWKGELEAMEQRRKNAHAYATIIGQLNRILSKGTSAPEGEGDLKDFEEDED